MIKNKIFKQGIEIAEKSQETRRDYWGGNNPYFDSNKNVYRSLSQNRDFWFTLPPQRSLLVSWLFSAIPIPCLKILFFHHSSYTYTSNTYHNKMQKQTLLCNKHHVRQFSNWALIQVYKLYIYKGA